MLATNFLESDRGRGGRAYCEEEYGRHGEIVVTLPAPSDDFHASSVDAGEQNDDANGIFCPHLNDDGLEINGRHLNGWVLCATDNKKKIQKQCCSEVPRIGLIILGPWCIRWYAGLW